MSFALVIVSGNPENPLNAGHLAELERFLDENTIRFSSQPTWLHIHKAAQMWIGDKPLPEQWAALRAKFAQDEIDVFVTHLEDRRKKLLLADMDATIVTTETLDELAAKAGIGEKIAAITARAMRGELDFRQALNERVGMLKDLPVSTLQETLEETVMSDGAAELVATMSHYGATCVLVSGGFTYFTGAVAAQLGFHHSHGNTFDIHENKLTGQVIPPILDKDAKLRFLIEYRDRMGLSVAETMAMGDGANDLPMLEEAGLGLGYHPKPLLLERLDNCIVHTQLTSALYIQGYSGQEIAHALSCPHTHKDVH